MLIGLGACVLDKSGTGPDKGAAAAAQPQILPTPGLTPKDRNIMALELLNEGKAEQARVELVASLAEQPANQNALAQNLLSQIDGDPITMLGKENFAHTVEKGELLSTIADKYLGDKFKFYVLARYNDMDNPSLLKVGEVIKVPGKKRAVVAARPAPEPEPAPPVATKTEEPAQPDTEVATKTEEPTAQPDTPAATKTEEPTAQPDTQVATRTDVQQPPKPQPAPQPEPSVTEKIQTLLTNAGDKADAGNYPAAIDILEDGLNQFPNEDIVKNFAAGIFMKFGASLLQQQSYQEAAAAVQRAATLAPANKDITGLLEEAKQAARADGLYQDGLRYEKQNAMIDAHDSFVAALKVWPDHDPAQMALAKVTPIVAEIYYREARTAFQKQDLDTALEYYNKTLEIDPNHEPAKLERQRTIQLQKKLAGKVDG